MELSTTSFAWELVASGGPDGVFAVALSGPPPFIGAGGRLNKKVGLVPAVSRRPTSFTKVRRT
jgi:hypothetical protein